MAPYSRADELRRIEDELRRVDSSSVVVPSDFRERLRMRLQVQADQNYLRAQKSAGAEALVGVAEELHLRWQADSPSGYIAVLGLASSLLLDFSKRSDLATMQATRFGSNILVLLPTVPLPAASMGAGILANEHIWRPELPVSSLLDLQPREEGLKGMLVVVSRLETFMQSFSPEAELAKLSAEERFQIKSGDIPSAVDGKRLSYAEQGRYRDLLKQIQDHRSFDKPPPDRPKDDPWTGHQGKLEKALASFVQKRYTLKPADLDEVQLALDIYAKDPALKERLVLAAYKGTNPFVGRTPTFKPIAEDEAKAAATTSEPAAKQGAEITSAKKATTQPVTDLQPTASDSVPMATASRVSVGNSVHWLAFAGAAALIVAVLWRAQARGNPGRGK